MNRCCMNAFMAFGIFVLHTSAFAQKNFRDGYVVLKSGDTLRGQIDYKNWEVNPSHILFQHGSDQTTYHPVDLHSFEITGQEKYVSSVIVEDMRPVDVMTLTYKPDDRDSTVTDTAFLRVVFDGPRVTLFAVNDHKIHFFIRQGQHEQVEELLYKKYIDDATSGINEKAIFRQQLGALVAGSADPESITRKIEKSHYQEADLLHILRLLNGESEKNAAMVESGKKTAIQLLVGAGIVDYGFKFTGSFTKWNALDFGNGAAPVANLAVDFFSGRDLQKLALRFAFSYNRLRYHGTALKNDALDRPTQYDYNLTQSNFTPEVDFLYHFGNNNNNFRLYGGVGIGFVFSSYPVNTYRSRVVATGETDVEDQPLNMSKLWISPDVLLGARIKNKINLGLAAKVGGGFVDYSGIHASFTPFTFTVSYIFEATKK